MKTIILEEHSSVLPEWQRLGLKGTTLIYLDAHIDLQYVSEKRIKALQQCQTPEELALLEKPHHMLPDVGYSYSIEDFLYPAYRLGMINRLVWVNPYNSASNCQKLISMLEATEGIALEDLSSFKQVGKVVEGKLLGLDITLCSYQDLETLELPEDSFIDIDTDYFIALPQDKPWIDPKIVFSTLAKLPLTSKTVTITRSVSSGYMPLRYRFFADYLAALWKQDQQEADHYSRLFEIDQQLQQNLSQEAGARLLLELEQFPDCAATYYLLSLTEANPLQKEFYHRQAASIDPGYDASLLRSVCEFASRGLNFQPQTLIEIEKTLKEKVTNNEEKALAHFTLAMLYHKLGQKPQVLKHYKSYKKILGRHPKLNLMLGQILYKAGNLNSSLAFLKAALADEMTTSDANKLIGVIYAKQGKLELACEHLLKVNEMIPAWIAPVNLLIKIYKKLGDEQNHLFMTRKFEQIQMINALWTQKFSIASKV